MSTKSSDLEQFHQFIAEQIARGELGVTPEDCLDLWRAAHPSPDEMAASLEAIEDGLTQARRGEGVPLDEFVRRFKAANGILDDHA